MRQIIEHYKLTLDVEPGRSKKKEVFLAILSGLKDIGLLEEGDGAPPRPSSPVKTIGAGLSFAEQRELWAMQFEFEARERQRDRDVPLELGKAAWSDSRLQGRSFA